MIQSRRAEEKSLKYGAQLNVMKSLQPTESMSNAYMSHDEDDLSRIYLLFLHMTCWHVYSWTSLSCFSNLEYDLYAVSNFHNFRRHSFPHIKRISWGFKFCENCKTPYMVFLNSSENLIPQCFGWVQDKQIFRRSELRQSEVRKFLTPLQQHLIFSISSPQSLIHHSKWIDRGLTKTGVQQPDCLFTYGHKDAIGQPRWYFSDLLTAEPY